MNILFRKVGVESTDVKIFQSNVEQAFQIIASLPFVDGDIFEVTVTDGAPFNINTGLGRSPQGWFPLDTNVFVTFFRTKGPLDEAGTLTLTPSEANGGTYKFWVF